MHPTSVATPVGTSQDHTPNNWSSSGVEVRLCLNTSARLDKHISVLPVSKWAAGGGLHCVAHNAILHGMIACGRAFFVLAPKGLASATCSP